MENKRYKISLYENNNLKKVMKSGLSYSEADKKHAELNISEKFDKKTSYLKLEIDNGKKMAVQAETVKPKFKED